jgi:hypothetical protein
MRKHGYRQRSMMNENLNNMPTYQSLGLKFPTVTSPQPTTSTNPTPSPNPTTSPTQITTSHRQLRIQHLRAWDDQTKEQINHYS